MPKKLPVFVMVAALLAPLYVATAQQAKVHRVGGILQGGPYYAMVDGLRNGLRALGWLEGTHFVLEIRDTQGNLKADEVAARALEREQVDLLYTVTTSVTVATQRATATVPIVFCAGTEWIGRVKHFLHRPLAAPETEIPVASDAARGAAATSEEQRVGRTLENF